MIRKSEISYVNIFLTNVLGGSNGLQPISRRQKFAEFVAMRLDTKRMVSCLWRVMCAASPFAGLVMTMKGVKGTRAVLSATLAISAIRVSLIKLSSF